MPTDLATRPTLPAVGWSHESAMHATGIIAPMPAIDGENGRIWLPGMSTATSPGLPLQAYVQMMHLYASILEADRLMEPNRDKLRLPGAADSPCFPKSQHSGALTELTPSTRHENLFYKREDRTVTKAYKVRGAFTGMARVMQTENCEGGFFAVSTGNHALGILKAAELLRPPSVRIVVPLNCAEHKLSRITGRVEELCEQGLNASIVRWGDNFDHARSWALEQAGTSDAYYLDPYCNPWVVSGQGTIGLELYRQVADLLATRPEVDEVAVVVPIGGGGLLSGVATAFKLAAAWDSRFRDVTVKFMGLRLASLESQYGDAIIVKHPAPGNGELFEALEIPVERVTDEMMYQGMKTVFEDIDARVEGPSGVTVVPVLTRDDWRPTETRLVVSLLSGGNVNDIAF
jgi:threonine dehydratase